MLEAVQPLQGTASSYSFSNGNTLPLVAVPFGMTHWTPQTREGGWIYTYGDHHFQGIRATHQPSPWIGDYGHLTFMPQTGTLTVDAARRASSFRHADEQVHPHYYSVYLRRYETRLEIAPTERCAVMRLTYPAGTPYLLIQPFEGAADIQIMPDHRRVLVCSRANRGGVVGDFGCYYWIEFDHPLPSWGVCQSDAVLDAGLAQLSGEKAGAYVAFDHTGEPVEIRVGTSFISFEQARNNLQREIGNQRFDAVRQRAAAIWQEHLGRVQLHDGTDEQRRTFYTALYRSLLFPRVWHDPDQNGAMHHFSPYDGQVHAGVLYADNGFWDTHRTVYPLLSILFPQRLGEMLDGWLNAYCEGGWLPKWSSPGYRNCMIGTHMDVIFADACLKRVPGFDYETAYEAIRKNGTELVPDDAPYGRIGLADYLALGYVPADRVPHATSRTLDFAYGDFGIAQLAGMLDHAEDERLFRQRAMNYRHVFDADSGFMRGRNADGRWQEPFDPVAWGGAFVEGAAWQHTWSVPHDPAGLIRLMGERTRFVEQLDRMLAMPPRFATGTYSHEIHEMSEMAAVDLGQYAHSNQPVHHVLYLYAAAGLPEKTRYWVHKVLTEHYSSQPDGLPGDEDNGEMSAWYVLSSLGLYQMCLGLPEYTVTAPLFEWAESRLPDDRVFTVSRHDPRTAISHAALMAGTPPRADG